MKIRKTYLMNEGMVSKIKAIQEEKNFTSETMVVVVALNLLYDKTFKDYVVGRGGRTLSDDEKADSQIKVADLKKQKEEARLLEIAKALNGEVIFNDGGGKVVRYFTYDKSNRYEQELPLTMMSEELISSQYFPSREEVEKRQKAGKVNY